MIRELIWAYPFAFVVTFCISVTIIGAVGVALCFSIKQPSDDK
jgi:hypothetical protein